jgi:hypothetical protein
MIKLIIRYTKWFFKRLNLRPSAAGFYFRAQQVFYYNRNRNYCSLHTSYSPPPHKALFETYKIDYQSFEEDGALAAKEIIAWCSPYLSNTKNPVIIDWGCGIARIIKHFPTLLPASTCIGIDINVEFIEWNKIHYPDIDFFCEPTASDRGESSLKADLLIAFSVFTHIPIEDHSFWLEYLSSKLSRGGILFITTHGTNFLHQLSKKERGIFLSNKGYTPSDRGQNSREITTYNNPQYFKYVLPQNFEILNHYEGKSHPQKAGGHDVWIIQKK